MRYFSGPHFSDERWGFVFYVSFTNLYFYHFAEIGMKSKVFISVDLMDK